MAGTDLDVIQSYKKLYERAKVETFGIIEDEFVVIDTETTGLEVDSCELIEIAALIMRGPNIVDRFQTFVDPGVEIPEFITELTSISQADVEGSPDAYEAVMQLDEFVGDRMLIAHNARFDRQFLSRPSSGQSFDDLSRWIDTLGLSRIAFPRLVAHDQNTMCDAFGIDRGGHRAQKDIEALAYLWRIMLCALSDMPPNLVKYISDIAPQTNWGGRVALKMVLTSADPALRDKPFSMQALRDERIKLFLTTNSKVLIDPDSEFVDLKPVERTDIDHAFSDDGIVGKMYENFERRDEQIDFAYEVSQAFMTSTHRVIEAGTGVGKSISYLLPAALFAIRNHVRVGIATKTNTLLDQLIFNEIPRLDNALQKEYGLGISSIALKGYDHYPCLRKLMRFTRFFDEKTTEFDITTVGSILTSIAQSLWGDLDSLTTALSHRVRMGVTCSADECLHMKCSYFPKRCLLHGARKKATESNIVVTNHALLFRDVALSKGVLPPIRYWVIDEAHGAEDEAREQLSYTIEQLNLQNELNKLTSSTGIIENIRERAVILEGATSLMGFANLALQACQKVSESTNVFFDFVLDLKKLEQSSGYATTEIWINSDVRKTLQWKNMEKSGHLLLDDLDRAIHECSALSSMSNNFEELQELNQELTSASSHLEDMLSVLSLVIDGTNEDYCYYAEIPSNHSFDKPSLVCALVDLGGELSKRFFPEENSVVMTSATIAVGKSFDYFSERMGLNRLEEGSWSAKSISPSEDFYKNMQTYLICDMPEPTQENYLEELEKLLKEIHLGLGGGILTLFTNRREMKQCYENIFHELKDAGIDLLCQGAGKNKRVLRDEFVNKEDACLFATRSFWEGFDAPGRTLRCVILPRLPFARPDDPLYQERNIRKDNAWKIYMLPQAVIDLRQAAGRLIRSKNDSGFLILADSRLTTKWYGKIFLSALPSSNIISTSISKIRAILEESNL